MLVTFSDVVDYQGDTLIAAPIGYNAAVVETIIQLPKHKISRPPGIQCFPGHLCGQSDFVPPQIADQVRNTPVVNVGIGPTEPPAVWILAEAVTHVFVDQLLQVNSRLS